MVEIRKPGPAKGSPGARRVGEAHRGSHKHDVSGGFAANPELAREAGSRGADFFSEIGKAGGRARAAKMGKRRGAA